MAAAVAALPEIQTLEMNHHTTLRNSRLPFYQSTEFAYFRWLRGMPHIDLGNGFNIVRVANSVVHIVNHTGNSNLSNT